MLWLSVRARWRRAFGPCLAVALLIGVAGGFTLAAIATARHVDSAYRSLIEEIDPPDLLVTPNQGETLVDEAVVMTGRMSDLPVVDRARPVEVVRPYLVDPAGSPLLATSDNPTGCSEGDRDVLAHGLVEGGPLDQVLPFRLDGALPRSDAQSVLSRATATRLGLDIGDVVRVAGLCSGDGDPVEIDMPIDLRITGLAIGAFDVEPPGTGRSFESMYVSAAVFEALRAEGAEGGAAVWLDRSASPTEVGEAFENTNIIMDLRVISATLNEALATDARLLWLLAALGAATGALLLVPIIGRNLRDTADPRATIAALGATPTQLAQRDVAHIVVLAVSGALIAATLAIPISLGMPIGLAEKTYQGSQLLSDGFVIAAGVAAIVLLVCALAVAPVVRSAWGRSVTSATTRHEMGGRRASPIVGTGLLSAVGRPAAGRHASPWPSMISTTVAAVVCVAGVTYLAGLRHLQQTPRLVGWNWDALVFPDEDPSSDDAAELTAAISSVDGVDVVTRGWTFPPAFVDESGSGSETWPWSFSTGVGAIAPVMLAGTAPRGPDEVALNEVLAGLIGLGVGDIVTFERPALVSQLVQNAQYATGDTSGAEIVGPDAAPVSSSFEITGIAVLPMERTEDFPAASFTLAGLAVLLTPSAAEVDSAREWVAANLPADMQLEAERSIASAVHVGDAPPAYLRFSGDPGAAAAAVGEIAGVESVLVPTAREVIEDGAGLDLSSQDRVPYALTSMVAVAAAAVLLYLLLAAVRARRGEFAMLRALGLSNGGIRRSVAAQTTVTALLPLLVSIPAGTVIGRWAWLRYARNLEVIPESPTPWAAIVVVIAAAITLANLAGLLLAWSATRRSTGHDLRAE